MLMLKNNFINFKTVSSHFRLHKYDPQGGYDDKTPQTVL